MNVNYKSDFAFVVEFDEAIPTYPWKMFFTTHSKSIETPAAVGYSAGFDGENYTNAHPNADNENQLIIEMSNHGLPEGELHFEWRAIIQNELFSDGAQRIVRPTMMPITLVDAASDQAFGSTNIESAVFKII